MLKLELKIPPLLLVLFFAGLMWLVSLWMPSIHISLSFGTTTFTTLAALGLFCIILGVVSFRKARTTVNPMKPIESSSLVTSGIYRYTRNPMYLGFLFLLIGWGSFLSNLYALSLVIGFVLYMNKFQIQPEERALESLFGAEFLTYKNKVRRWL